MFEQQPYRRFLVVAAHHDDESLFFGGTLVNIAEQGGRDILIVVLTGVQWENPPTTPEQEANEPRRQANRLGAFQSVCYDLSQRIGTSAYCESDCLRLPQVNKLSAPDAHAIEEMAYSNLLAIFREFQPDCILTHGRDGDYTGPKYGVPCWDDAREQHKLAHRLVRRLPDEVPPGRDAPAAKWGYDLLGEMQVRVEHEAKMRLLSYYRVGCTQTPEWRAELNYPEFVLTERFTAI